MRKMKIVMMTVSLFALSVWAIAVNAQLNNIESTRSEKSLVKEPAVSDGKHGNDTHSGEQLYKTHCAACHDNSSLTKAPPKETLARYSEAQIANALSIMRAQGGKLTSSERETVGSYLSQTAAADHDWIKGMMCAKDNRVPKLDGEVTVSTFGFDRRNTRNLSYDQAGLEGADFGSLELAWAIAFPEAISMRSQPAVVGSTLFLPVGESRKRLFAIDVSEQMKPCLQWVYEGDKTLRSSAGYGVLPNGRSVVMVGDFAGFVHMVDAQNGQLIWRARAGLFDRSILTGTPVLVGSVVYAPSSQFDPLYAVNDDYLCCKFHGGVVALDALTGKKIWEGHALPDAKPIRDRGDGQMHWGPAGAPVWNSPSIDLKRNQLYVGTGEANSVIDHPHTDALLAFDLDDGSINWSFQATEKDIFNPGCGPDGSGGLNCAKDTVYRDVDFGASTILATAPNGRELLLAGQKSGTVWAMNPDNGEVIWRRDIGTGGLFGGVHWGLAVDDTHIYAPIGSAGESLPGQVVPPELKPGLYAINLNDGTIDWSFELNAECGADERKFVPACDSMFGLSGAVTLIGDHLVVGALDGQLYVVDRNTGKLVWKYNTARAFDTINGVEGNGAAIDNASIVAANGLVFVNSGYGLFGHGAGNVMLAFRPTDSRRQLRK